jgi:hypothetical protein
VFDHRGHVILLEVGKAFDHALADGLAKFTGRELREEVVEIGENVRAAFISGCLEGAHDLPEPRATGWKRAGQDIGRDVDARGRGTPPDSLLLGRGDPDLELLRLLAHGRNDYLIDHECQYSVITQIHQAQKNAAGPKTRRAREVESGP